MPLFIYIKKKKKKTFSADKISSSVVNSIIFSEPNNIKHLVSS